jgi:hypothetical protein
MVRPELRRDMVGVPEISVPQERIDVGHPGGMSSPQGPTVLGNPVPRDGSEPRPSARILRKEKEITALCARRTPCMRDSLW